MLLSYKYCGYHGKVALLSPLYIARYLLRLVSLSVPNPFYSRFFLISDINIWKNIGFTASFGIFSEVQPPFVFN